MHLGEGKIGSGSVHARIVSDLEGGVEFHIARLAFSSADYAIKVSGAGRSIDVLNDHVAERDPDGAPGVISVDPGIRVVAEPIGDNAGERKKELFKGPLEIIELPAQPVAETS
jgi:hypothetical protein